MIPSPLTTCTSSTNGHSTATRQVKAQMHKRETYLSSDSSKRLSLKSKLEPNSSVIYHHRTATKINSPFQHCEVRHHERPHRYSRQDIGSAHRTLIFAAITFTVLFDLQPAAATTAGELAALASASSADPENTLSCHRRHYTKIVSVEDENGKVCWDHVNIMSCWGRCDSNEIADWKFPYKRSHHPVCLHASTRQNSVVLQNCDPDVLSGTELHVFQEADICSCSLCKSSEASCEGLRYRGARRAPRDTANVLEGADEGEVGEKKDSKGTQDLKRFWRDVSPVVGEARMSSDLNAASTSSIVRVKKNVVPDGSFFASEAMQPALFFSSEANEPRSEPQAREQLMEGYDPLTGRDEGIFEPLSNRSANGFNFLAQNRPIGARGIGVISSVVESDPAYGSEVKNNSNVFSISDTGPAPISDTGPAPLEKFTTFFNKYPKLLGAGNRREMMNFNHFSGKYPLKELGYSTPDNMMKPMLDLKKKRLPEGY